MLSKSELKKRTWFVPCLDEDGNALSSLCYLAGHYSNLYSPFFYNRDFDLGPFKKALEDNSFNCQAHEKSEMARIIRAAFELGYIEQAMACQRILDGIPD